MDKMTEQSYVNERYPLSGLTGKVISAAQIVHRELGPGFEEVIYQRALALELPAQGLEYSREVLMEVYYRGKRVGRKRVDFLIDDATGSVIVEIKAKSTLEKVDFVQALSYLKASNLKVGLLLNFGAKQLEIRRLVHSLGS
jgi:GxxExxY protein